ncbi:MAG: hypothetical protein ACRENE_32875 [Polyangiaceae bacterium]
MKRALKPRRTDALRVEPIAITDRTAPALTGLESSVFRAFVLAHAIPHVRHGRRMIVDAEVFRGALVHAARSTGGTAVSHAPDANPADEDADDEPVSADRLLRRLGRERIAGTRGQ